MTLSEVVSTSDRVDAKAKLAFSPDELCRLTGISRVHFYSLIKAGRGPKLIKLGRRTLIYAESAHQWLRDMEAATREEAA